MEDRFKDVPCVKFSLTFVRTSVFGADFTIFCLLFVKLDINSKHEHLF